MKKTKSYLMLFLCLTIGLTGNVANGQVCFLPAVNYNVDSNSRPRFITSADFDENGSNDLAVSLADSNKFAIFKNKGNGEFYPPVYFETNTYPEGIINADFNSDGHSDLAVSCKNSNCVAIHLGIGNGSFYAPSYYPVHIDPLDLFSIDVNQDSILDIVTANGGSYDATVLFGDGTGGFVFGENINVGGPGFVFDITCGDFNQDGFNDLAASNGSYAEQVAVVLGTGGGSFAPRIYYPAEENSDIITADFNGDGKLDLATGSISILFGDGNGTFGPEMYLGNGGTSIGCNDMDCDGNIDIVVTHYQFDGKVAIMLGNGTGLFEEPIVFSVGMYPTGLVIADFDNDGKPDISTNSSYSDNISILINCTETVVVETESKTIRGFVYPNPISGIATLNLGQMKLESVLVYSVFGTIVLESKSKNIDFSAFPNGIYLVKVETDKGILMDKVVVQRD